MSRNKLALVGEGIDFDEAEHRYTVAGKDLPSVTKILKPWSAFGYMTPAMLARLEEARIRGVAVHAATALFDEKALDAASLDWTISDYLQGWIMFLHEWQFEPELIETMVASLQYGYAGTLDRKGMGVQPGRRKRESIMLDIKSGDEDPSHGPQTAGYSLPLQAVGVNIDLRATVYLSPGKYRVQLHRDESDRATFLAAIAFHQWRKRHNLGEQ